MKHIVKQLQDRLNQIEKGGNGEAIPSRNDVEKLPSSNNVEDKKEENPNLIVDYPNLNSLDTTKTINDKVIDDLKHEIALIKDKLPNVQLVENELDNMKK